MELKDTVEMMLSEDYKERFKAEYYQLKIRCDNLRSMLAKYASGTLDFEPACSYVRLADQSYIMHKYLHILKTRADIEGIEL